MKVINAADPFRPQLPRANSKKHTDLGHHLDRIDRSSDDAIHKGYVRRNVHKLDAALEAIITAAEAARALLRRSPS
jgi:hypothetical protein